MMCISQQNLAMALLASMHYSIVTQSQSSDHCKVSPPRISIFLLAIPLIEQFAKIIDDNSSWKRLVQVKGRKILLNRFIILDIS